MLSSHYNKKDKLFRKTISNRRLFDAEDRLVNSVNVQLTDVVEFVCVQFT